jgi:hypothetical protein
MNVNIFELDNENSFELHTIEVLFTIIKTVENKEFEYINIETKKILKYYKKGALLSASIQNELKKLKNGLNCLQRRVVNCQRALIELTDNDEDMALMSLSLLKRKPFLYKFFVFLYIFNFFKEIFSFLDILK